MAPLVPARRFAWLLLVCGLLIYPRASFAEQQIYADFDGDGQRDHATLDTAGTSTLRIWSSRTGTVRVIRSRQRLVRLAAFDLDGDGRPELVAADASTGLHVWKSRTKGRFKTIRPRRALPVARAGSHRQFEDDPIAPDDAQPTRSGTPEVVDEGPLVSTSFVQFPVLSRDEVHRPRPVQGFSPSSPRAPPHAMP